MPQLCLLIRLRIECQMYRVPIEWSKKISGGGGGGSCLAGDKFTTLVFFCRVSARLNQAAAKPLLALAYPCNMGWWGRRRHKLLSIVIPLYQL